MKIKKATKKEVMKAMKLTTKRLILRDIQITDAESIRKNINNLNVSRYLLAVAHPYTKKDAEWWVNHCKESQEEKPRKNYEFGIELKSQKGIIGGVGVSKVDSEQGTAELGYWLSEKYWRQGIMTEAVEKAIRFAFQKLKLRKLIIPTFKVNEASNGLAKKFGFKYEGTLREHGKAKSTGKIYDENIYGLLKKEWKGLR